VTGRAEQAVRALPDPVRRRYRDSLLGTLDRDPEQAFSRPAELISLSPDQRDWIGQAQKKVRTIAEEREIEPALIASKRELTRIARGDRPDWLSGWRGDLLHELLPDKS
ncbi:MAG: hypothetical protein ABR550_12755, partial [Wenzhouxiangellaceae bacterium]